MAGEIFLPPVLTFHARSNELPKPLVVRIEQKEQRAISSNSCRVASRGSHTEWRARKAPCEPRGNATVVIID